MACCRKARKLKKIQEQRMKKLRMGLVKDPKWAKIKISISHQWKKKPEWCCSQLKEYMGPIPITPDNKLNIVFSYLSGSGFSGGRVNTPCIRTLFSTINMEVKKRETKK